MSQILEPVTIEASDLHTVLWRFYAEEPRSQAEQAAADRLNKALSDVYWDVKLPIRVTVKHEQTT